MRRNFKTMLLLLEHLEKGRLNELIEHPVGKGSELRNIQSYVERKRQNLLEHLLLLKESGYVNQLSISFTEDGLVFHGQKCRLTMKGHDLLAIMRSKPMLTRMQEILAGTGLPLTADSLALIQHEAIDELVREWAVQHKKLF